METPLENLGVMFYMVSPQKSTYQYEEEVPHYSETIVVYALLYILLDTIVSLLRRRKLCLANGISSMSAGLINDSVRVVTLGMEFLGYKWLYKYRLLEWQWDSIWTWWMAFVVADFGFYVAHRAGHEIAIFWAGHASHHDSELFNAFTGLREATLRRFFSIGVYLPGALLGVPYPAMLVHVQLNIIYQFWLHTENIPSLGPVEWIFNTPSLHKIHHGRNKWCLDKNYGGILIIFDRLFGTYQGPRYDEEIYFGIMEQPKTYEPIYQQTGYIKVYLEKALSMESLGDKFRSLFYGPGWYPGTPRLGDPDAIPDKTEPRPMYNPPIANWLKAYSSVHFLALTLFHHKFVQFFEAVEWYYGWGFFIYILVSCSLLGQLFDGQPWAPLAELIRCIATSLTFILFPFLGQPRRIAVLTNIFTTSTGFWLAYILINKEKTVAVKEIKEKAY